MRGVLSAISLASQFGVWSWPLTSTPHSKTELSLISIGNEPWGFVFSHGLSLHSLWLPQQSFTSTQSLHWMCCLSMSVLPWEGDTAVPQSTTSLWSLAVMHESIQEIKVMAAWHLFYLCTLTFLLFCSWMFLSVSPTY